MILIRAVILFFLIVAWGDTVGPGAMRASTVHAIPGWVAMTLIWSSFIVPVLGLYFADRIFRPNDFLGILVGFAGVFTILAGTASYIEWNLETVKVGRHLTTSEVPQLRERLLFPVIVSEGSSEDEIILENDKEKLVALKSALQRLTIGEAHNNSADTETKR